MDNSWLAIAVSAVIFISTVFLSVICLGCRRKRPPAYISQAVDEYVPSTNFGVIHPAQRTPSNLNSSQSPTGMLSPLPNSVNSGTQWRQPSITPTETESNASYENQVKQPDHNSDYENVEKRSNSRPESQQSDPDGYIQVLPSDDKTSKNPSRASSCSSDNHEYVNVGNSAESSSSSEDEGNYVNQPAPSHCQPNP
ncbi:linker for activation of T-cells family member 1 isoform 2-T2 [Pholidichthys leucotaenia]